VAQARILLIDHRPDNLRQPVLRLELEGYQVEEASTAEEGLSKLRASRHDLLLLDAELPGDRDGWSILKEIRQDPALESTRVIIFMAGQGETGKLGLYEVQGELRRPFPIGELLDKVQRALSA
jgi:two-component system KDP operon response regulator KdpE